MLSTVFANPPVTPVTPACAPGSPAGDCAHTIEGLGPIFVNIISILIPVGGIILFIMLVVGGFSMMTSSGDPRRAEGAKNTITYAILGVVVLALAFLIIQIIAAFTGVPSILNFVVVQ